MNELFICAQQRHNAAEYNTAESTSSEKNQIEILQGLFFASVLFHLMKVFFVFFFMKFIFFFNKFNSKITKHNYTKVKIITITVIALT